MTDETELVILGDTHLGRYQYSSKKRRKDFARSFDEIIQYAINEEVDAVVHTGDLFEDPDPPLPDVISCDEIISNLSDAGIPFYAIVGNHERKLDEQWMDLFERHDNAHRLDMNPTIIDDRIVLYGVDSVRGPAWNSKEFDFVEPEDEYPHTIVAMHELFTPLVPEHRGADYSMEETLERFNITPDAMALGDYHSRTEEFVNDVHCFYPGSTERTSSAETSSRGFYHLTADDEEMNIRTRLIENISEKNIPREFKSIEVELGRTDNLDDVKKRVEERLKTTDVPNSEVVVSVKIMGEDVPVTVRDVEKMLKNSLGVEIYNVNDKRVVDQDLDVDVDDVSIEDINTMLDEAIEEIEASKLTKEIETVVRSDNDIAKTNLRDEVREKIEEVEDSNFGDNE